MRLSGPLGGLWWVVCALALASAAARADVSVTDDRGVVVRWAQPPQRIVSLLPSLTETVCEMGACSRLVGVDRYANHPASVRALPHLGGLDDVDIEAVVALRPDVVLLARSSRAIDRFSALGLKVVALEPRTQEDVERVASKLGQVLGQADAGPRLWQRLQARIAAAAQGVPAQAHGWRVYFEVDSAPYAASAGSFIGAVLAQLGLVNIVPTALGPFPRLNPEFVVRGNPQLIMVSARQVTGLSDRPGWQSIEAVQRQRICAFTPEQMDVLSRPGPRLGEAAEVMAACVRRMVEARR